MPTKAGMAKTEDDLKNLLLDGLDEEVKSLPPSSPAPPGLSSTALPRAEDTTDGSGGFNSGGDVADITSDGKLITLYTLSMLHALL